MPATGPATGSAIVEARDLGWRHASRRDPALQGVSLRVECGEKILLTGNSGAGKSTLLSALAGILGDEEDGESMGSLSINGTVGMVLQDPDSQVIASRIGDDVAFGCENLRVPREEIWPRVRRALDLVGLDFPLDHPTRYLSGGQKQRLALAGVIAMEAELILLDEPTANLDPEGQREVVAAVKKVVAETGASLIVVEHRPHLWAPMVDRYVHLDAEGLREITSSELPSLPMLPAAPPVPDSTAALVEARDLQPYWGPPRTLELPEGCSTVITGPNGAGKSTVALTLAGLVAPVKGELRYAEALRQGLNTPPHKWSSRDLATRVGYVFQDPEHQFVARTVAEEMAVSGGSQDRIDDLLQRLRLAHLAQANPFTLSGGEKRRLSVATALVATPRLLILDEPTFGQDPTTFVELVGLVRELTDQGVTVASITHDELFLHALGDHEVRIR
ncbi:ABC transporter ATP-binding protein [Corynebacterium testudinoris]|uniref:ABC superfamily ATP binding cassette transporter, ABC protein n=1 Tax=Corynebacterium testudinoris TaxID=136857 RepID=A0A0G3H943_9CORY|nr:ABC transporter ATP-binding protein [Corynebacterium testudinoris]AKK08388.1 ABC superfamily ATP binding cassette transporter, ABC protein [Corynebacterium testudinoris]MBX8994600.1 ABC transporter ATP-binding protein [Corynebacterium testudinoris]